MNDLQERLSRLSSTRRELFARRVSGEKPKQAALAIQPRPGLQYPLTPEQEHVWLIHHLADNAFYLNISHAYLMQGQLDVLVLKEAVNEIIRRHENLRTRFPEADGRPEAVIALSLRISLPVVDLTSIVEEQRKEQLKEFMRGSICRQFDVMNGPLVRGNVYKLAEQEHALLITIHHLVTDRLSYDVFTRELAVLYKAFLERRPSPLAPLKIQYGDYATWLHAWLQTPAADVQREFWKKKLANLTPLDLPTDRPRPLTQTFRGERQRWRVQKSLWEGFKAFCVKQNVTRFMGLLALYAVVLHAHTGKEDVLIGVPTNSRKDAETQGLIGYFLNTLALRVDLSGDPAFTEFLRRVWALTLDTMAHSDLPFESLFQHLGIARDPSRPPLIETSYAYTNDVIEPVSHRAWP